MQSLIEYRRIRSEVRTEYRNVNDDKPASRHESRSNTHSSKDDSYEVKFAGSDTHQPLHWPLSKKTISTCLLFGLVFVTGWASASDSSTLQRSRARFHVWQVPEVLSTALYLFGVGTGALFAGPVSQIVGRNPLYFGPGLLYLLALFGSALAPNYATRIIMRMFAGFFASPAMTNYGGSLSDMYETGQRSIVWPIFSLSTLLGPLTAPIPSGWIENSRLNWRWTDWLTLIISGFAFLLAFLFLPETHLDTIVGWKVGNVQKVTNDKRWHAADEESATVIEHLKTHAHDMLIYLTREPITILFGLYLTLLYILVYTFLHGFTYIFGKAYGWNPGQRGSAFGAVCVGVLLGVPYVMLFNHIYKRRHRQRDPEATPLPESRLIPTIPIAPLLPISLFWLGFTDRPDISYFSPLGACALFGFSLYTIFVPTYHYLIDAYKTNSSSAMAAVTFMRYYASGGMIIAAIPMYEAIGVKWVMVLMGCVAALLTPVPLLFWWKGDAVRAKSRFADKGGLQGNKSEDEAENKTEDETEDKTEDEMEDRT